MSLLCQKDSYIKEFKSPVKSCQKSQLNLNGTIIDGFEIVLEDSIFFPEGGGQPYDTGLLGSHEVVNVRREGNQAVLFVKASPSTGDSLFEVGEEPLQKINWKRRFDHMQQHSGQHLITAVALKEFNFPTTSWSLGSEISNIELDTATIPDEVVSQIEKLVNDKIRENLPISVSYREQDDLTDVRRHFEIPGGDVGALRVISIDGLDKNACCGTHVSNLSDLQAIKLLGVQKGKKGKSLLYFVSGNRVLDYFNDCVKREKVLTTMLKCPNEEIVLMVEKMQKTIKRLQKNSLTATRDLAKYEAERYLNDPNKPKLFSLLRKEGEYDFISIFVNTVGDAINDRLILLAVADDCLTLNSPGQIMIAGDENLVKKASEIACTSFGAKGSVSRAKFRGRIADVSKLNKLEEQILKNVVES